jgi:ferredoxin hydrogenase
MAKWKCKVCGFVYEGEQIPENYVCPVCKKDVTVFEQLEEPNEKVNKYAGTKSEKN